MKSAKRQFIEKLLDKINPFMNNQVKDKYEEELLEAIEKDSQPIAIDFAKWLMDNATPSDVSIEQFYEQYLNQK